MKSAAITQFLCSHGEFFPKEQHPEVRALLEDLPEAFSAGPANLKFRDPTTALFLSLVLGGASVDRFYVGHVGLGIGKLALNILTLWTLGLVWVVVDWFLIRAAARQLNLHALQGFVLLAGGASGSAEAEDEEEPDPERAAGHTVAGVFTKVPGAALCLSPGHLRLPADEGHGGPALGARDGWSQCACDAHCGGSSRPHGGPDEHLDDGLP